MTSIRLSRPNSNTSWGFRIHGGKDFNQPLIILKVSGGSVSEQSGLSAGDAILRINNVDALPLKHKEAQDLILNSGNQVELVVQKGATSTWAPRVTPLSEVNHQQQVFTKTSLKKDLGPKYVPPVGINSNVRPFATTKGGQSLVNKQFNTPINLYSEKNLQETLSAQAEVLAGGAIGVNFKKNEKEYNYEDSAVYKMLKQIENEPPSAQQNHVEDSHHQSQSVQIPIGVTPYTSSQKSPVFPSQNLPSQQSLLKSVHAPQTNPNTPAGGNNPNVCAECDRLIVGVFVRIKDKNLHVECFRCSTCGQSLKNIGYFNINNKLYCDVHAKTVAKANPPGPGLEPYTTLLPSSGELPLLPSLGEEFPLPLPNPCQGVEAEQGIPLSPATSAPAPPFEQDISVQASAAQNLAKTIPINKPYSYTGPPLMDSYAANVAPQPYHHSPTGTHHVTAPKSPIKTPTQNQLFSSTGSSSSSSKQIYESKQSSSSFSETITKSGGSKYIWPPPKEEEGQASPAAEVTIPIQNSFSSSSSANYSSYGSTAAAAPIQTTGITIPINTTGLPSSGYTAPSFTPFGGGAATPYKPVAPPKPAAYKQQHLPYKPVASLLTTAPKLPTSAPVAPAFGGPSSFTGFGTGLKAGAGAPVGGRGKGQFGRGILPNRGKGILNQAGPRIAVCGTCQRQIRGPFVTAGGGKIYCPEHFKCNSSNCQRALIDIGYVEERGALYCEFCWESYLAPECGKCRRRIKNECLNALGQHFHPQCFACTHCNTVFGNNPFYLEDGRPFCEKDWNEMFTTKCYACTFPIEAGDRWVEAMAQNYHSQCFNCSACKKNLEGQSFFAKGGRPFCKQHAR